MSGVKKTDWTMMGWRALIKAAECMTDPRGGGWRNGTPEEHASACLRHLSAWMAGEKTDKESGRSHLVHVLCRAMMATECEIDAEETK